MKLSEAKVLVTGGSSGIGRATAKLFVDEGASVVICGRTQNTLNEAAAETGAIAIRADVSHEPDVERLVAGAIEKLGGLNVLVNNAGIGSFAPLVEETVDDFRWVWETNVLGAMLVARECARHFIRENFGNIINVASTSAHRGYAGGSAYVSSKFALTGLTQCWRYELRNNNIRVMQVNPSEVITEFTQRAGLGEKEQNPTKLHPEEIARLMADMLRMRARGFVTDATVWATNPQD